MHVHYTAHSCLQYCIIIVIYTFILLIALTLTLCAHIHIHTHTCTYTCTYTEPSLTLDTLSSILESVQRLDGFGGVGFYLQIPRFKRDELGQQYNRRQLSRAYSTVFLTENPSPSWSTVALAMWEAGEHGALEVVQKLYLKGEPCAHSCRGEGSYIVQ